jgi:hypothetical protein
MNANKVQMYVKRSYLFEPTKKEVGVQFSTIRNEFLSDVSTYLSVLLV